MASCEEYELLISRSFDGDLSPEEELHLQTHLASCPACASLYEDLSVLQASFASFSLSPPAALQDRVMNQIRQETALADSAPRKPTRLLLLSRRYAASAAALVILVSALVFGSRWNLLQAPEPEAPVTADESAPAAASTPAPRTLSETPAPAESQGSNTNDSAPKASASKKLPSDQIKKENSSLPATTTPKAAPPAVVESSPPPSALTEFAAKDQISSAPELSQSDAESLLMQYLQDEGKSEPSLRFSRLLEDGSAFEFLYTDSQGETWVYSVSRQDGSISRTPSSGEPLSTLP